VVLQRIESDLASSPPNFSQARRSLRAALEHSDACFNQAQKLIDDAEQRNEQQRAQAACRSALQQAENLLRNSQYLAAIDAGERAQAQGCRDAAAFLRRANLAYDEARRTAGPIWN